KSENSVELQRVDRNLGSKLMFSRPGFQIQPTTQRCKALQPNHFSPTRVVRDIDCSSVYALIEEAEMKKPPTERFEILQTLHIPGLDKRSDELVELCYLAMEKKPTDEITARLIEIGIQAAITAKDRVELEEQRALLTDEERDICEALERMTDDE